MPDPFAQYVVSEQDPFAKFAVPVASHAPAVKERERPDTNVVGVNYDWIANKASKLPEPLRYPAAYVGSLLGTGIEAVSSPEGIGTMGMGRIPSRVPAPVGRGSIKGFLRTVGQEVATSPGVGIKGKIAGRLLAKIPATPDEELASRLAAQGLQNVEMVGGKLQRIGYGKTPIPSGTPTSPIVDIPKSTPSTEMSPGLQNWLRAGGTEQTYLARQQVPQLVPSHRAPFAQSIRGVGADIPHAPGDLIKTPEEWLAHDQAVTAARPNAVRRGMINAGREPLTATQIAQVKAMRARGMNDAQIQAIIRRSSLLSQMK